MSGAKRKVAELGGHVLSAAVGDVVTRTMSAAVGRFEARASADEQLERLGTLSIMVHSAVEAAECVHIQSWWLRRWLWKLRDAALDADEVLRLFRQQQQQQQRADEETKDAAATRPPAGGAGNTVWHALRSVKSLLFGGGDDDDKGVERLSRTVARLEREAMGLGDFLKVLDLEVRRSLALAPPQPPVAAPPVQSWLEPPPVAVRDQLNNACIMMRRFPARGGDRPRFDDHGLSSISHEEYVAGVRKMGLRVAWQRLRRALDWLVFSRRKTPAPPLPPAPPAPDSVRELVTRIHGAIVRAASGGAAKRSWLAAWRSQLLTAASSGQLLAASAMAAGGGRDGDPWGVTDGRMRRAAQAVETAAAHLQDFVTLTNFALASSPDTTLSASPSTYTSEQTEALSRARAIMFSRK